MCVCVCPQTSSASRLLRHASVQATPRAAPLCGQPLDTQARVALAELAIEPEDLRSGRLYGYNRV
jgi:hypothetical protein